ncbi:DUF2079 domain-containing protein [Hymenobacter edaphi]|uniref:DUF2079 domain-containing protein n=1 Tax=Hymenobacter edaphi TaxID=2211146 RepID=UPI001057A359|nr:DUF2079 domain-containing protein [Hymenobacter edaphi]
MNRHSTLTKAAPGTARQRNGARGLLLGFGLIYALVSLVNHYLMRTAAFDLGIATHALRSYAHLRAHYVTELLDTPATNFLSSNLHFALVPLLVSPLYWLLGSWTLLVVQIAAVLWGGWGVHVFARARGASYGQANVLMAFFFSSWGIYSALGYDYHDNVVGAMAVPWLVHWFEQRRWGRALLAFGLLLVSKENLALWAAAIMLGLAWKHWRTRPLLLVAVLGAVAALAYFAVITKLVMPGLSATHQQLTQIQRYQHLGGSLEAAVLNVATHPTLLWQCLFENITADPNYNYIKAELWAVLLLSGGLALALRPWYALMLAPILAQKLLANDYGLWGINAQYSIEFAPVLALAVTELGLQLRQGPPRQRYYAASLALAGLATVVTLYTRQSKWYQRETTNFLLAKHYRSTQGLDVRRLRRALDELPAEVPLSAQANLAPWLINRDRLYHFPVLRDAQLVALLKTDKLPWPLAPEAYLQAQQQLRTRGDFRVRYEDDQLLVLERTRPPAQPDEVLPFKL